MGLHGGRLLVLERTLIGNSMRLTTYLSALLVCPALLLGQSISRTELKATNSILVSAIADKVAGPITSTDNAVVRFNGSFGHTAQNSGVIISDGNDISGVQILTLEGINITGTIEQDPGTGSANLGTVTLLNDLLWFSDKAKITAPANNTFSFLDEDSVEMMRLVNGGLSFRDNTRSLFNPGADASGLNVGSHAGDPGSLLDGDIWYNSSAGALKARINGATVSLGAGGGGAGDLVGPASATDNAIPAYDGTTGKLVKNSAKILTSGGSNITASGSVSANGLVSSNGITSLGSANGFLELDDATSGKAYVTSITNVSQNVTNVYVNPWPVGLGWCWQVASSNGFMVRWTNGPCGSGSASITGSDTRVLFFDGANSPAGDGGLTYNKTTDSLTVVGAVTAGSVTSDVISNQDPDTGTATFGETTVKNLTSTTLSSNTIVVVGPGGIITTGILGSGLSYNAATRTLTASGGVAPFTTTNLIAGATNNQVWDAGSFPNATLWLLTNLNRLIISNLLGPSYLTVQEDTNGTREIQFSYAGGMVLTNASKSLRPGTNASIATTYKFLPYGPTNIQAALWETNISAVAFTNSLSEAGGGGGGGVDLMSGLLAYHDMEEGDGANRADATASGLNLTNAGSMLQSLTHIEGSFSAHPNTGSSALTNGASGYRLTTDFTEMLWFQASASLDAQQLIGRCCDENAWEVGFGTSGTIPFFVRNAANNGYVGTVTSTVNIDAALNKWHVLYFGYTSSGTGTNWISIDGEDKVLAENTQGIRAVTQPIVVGGLTSGGVTAATVIFVDAHATWTRMLSDDEIDYQINSYDFSAQTGSPKFKSGGSW